MKISWLLLTYGRERTVKQSVAHNLRNAGYDNFEIIWVDNGSDVIMQDMMTEFSKYITKKVHYETNQGVSVGYNTAMSLSRNEWMCITGCDTLMKENWMKTWVEHIQAMPDTGVATMYCNSITKHPERVRGKEQVINGKTIIPAMPMGRRIFSRDLLRKTGYLREDFGLYGWEDVEWAYRAERVCSELGLRFYNIPGQEAVHLGTEGAVAFDFKDEHEYWRWKKAQVEDKEKQKLLSWCEENKYPFYTPY